MQSEYRELSLKEKHDAAIATNKALSQQLAVRYNRHDLVGIDLPFLEDGELAREILGRRK